MTDSLDTSPSDDAITLPSGLRVAFRPWTSHELVKLFESAQRVKGGSLTPYYRALIPVWLETRDSGPYSSDIFPVGDAKPADAWKRMLYGDVLASLVHVRRISLSDEFSFPVRCTWCGHTGGSATVRLSEMPVRTLPSVARATILADKRFTLDFEGRKLEYDLMSPAQDELMEALLDDLRRKKVISHNERHAPSTIERLAIQIRSIDGNADKIKRWEFVAGLRGGLLFDLRDKIAEFDCGIEQAIDCECGSCHATFEASVPLVVAASFWVRPVPSSQTFSSE